MVALKKVFGRSESLEFTNNCPLGAFCVHLHVWNGEASLALEHVENWKFEDRNGRFEEGLCVGKFGSGRESHTTFDHFVWGLIELLDPFKVFVFNQVLNMLNCAPTMPTGKILQIFQISIYGCKLLIKVIQRLEQASDLLFWQISAEISEILSIRSCNAPVDNDTGVSI